MQKLGFSPGLPSISERVPPAQRARLAASIAKSGVPAIAYDKMETWAAAFLLMGNQFKSMGLQSGQGVESVLRNNFLSDNKPIGELETNFEQLSYFDRLPENAQRALLIGAIMETPASKKEFSGMLTAWSRGDVAAIARSFDKDMAILARAQAVADQAAQRQLEQVDRAAFGPTRSRSWSRSALAISRAGIR